MNRTHWLGVGLLAWGACTGELTRDSVDSMAQEVPAVARPEGWSEASHGKKAAPDYARLFPDDRVQRLDIVLAPEESRRMLDDLRERMGDPATRKPAAANTACQGLPDGAACTFLGLQGVCTSKPRVASALRGHYCESSDTANSGDLVPGDPIVVPATVRYDGRVWNHVAVHYRGNSSLTIPWSAGMRKFGLKLNFDKLDDAHPEIKGQRFFGFGEMVLAPNFTDTSQLREKLAADLLRDQGIVAAQAGYYRVFVDAGEGPVYWGLYTMLEDPTDRLLDVRFGDDSGNVYKPDGPGAEFATFDTRWFDKRNNDLADFSDVKRLFDALHATYDDPAQFRQGIEAALDVEAFLQNLAFDRVVNHWDSYGTYPHNYYLYGDPRNAGRLVWISWDFNNSWTPDFRGQSSPMLDELPRSAWPLLKLLSDPVYRPRYREHLARLSAGPYAKQRFDAHARALHELIKPYVVGPEGERPPYGYVTTPESFTAALNGVIAAADGRRAAISQALARESATQVPASP